MTTDSDSNDSDDTEADIEDRKRKLLAAAAIHLLHRRRFRTVAKRRHIIRNRRRIEELLVESSNEGFFRREYRMSVDSFNKLCDLLADDIGPSTANNMARNAMSPRLVLATALCYFALARPTLT
jgi:hypothetical protein